jgi:hypothetical protein
MISTRDLSEMPAIQKLKRLLQSIATLDAIIERDWKGRYYSFNSKWDGNEQMASMRSGEGDSWFCVFGTPGAFLKGFAHESKMASEIARTGTVWPGVLSDLPEQFKSFAAEPAFSMRETTFCIWRTHTDLQWNVGKIAYPEDDDPDGSAKLLSILDANPNTYQVWAEDYYKRPVNLLLVEHIYSCKPLTERIVQGLNSSSNIADLSDDLREIGYPVSAN